jgi:transcriptional regulator with XRE-family HTH domain
MLWVPNHSLHRHIATRIRSLAGRRNWSGNHLADTAGVSRAAEQPSADGPTAHAADLPTIGLLAKIAATLEVSLRDLLPPAR